ncbi:MAG: hypothetical protein Q4E01_07970, partial [Actinomycetaceae bacterium]|nr:hypothetical protein [Actinomycetaceae bacterium]
LSTQAYRDFVPFSPDLWQRHAARLPFNASLARLSMAEEGCSLQLGFRPKAGGTFSAIGVGAKAEDAYSHHGR